RDGGDRRANLRDTVDAVRPADSLRPLWAQGMARAGKPRRAAAFAGRATPASASVKGWDGEIFPVPHPSVGENSWPKNKLEDGMASSWIAVSPTATDVDYCLLIAVTSPEPLSSLRSNATSSPTATLSISAGAALNAMVIAGQFASAIGPCSSVMVPAVSSIAFTVPVPLATFAVSAGIAMLPMSPDISPIVADASVVLSGLSVFWPQAASSTALPSAKMDSNFISGLLFLG